MDVAAIASIVGIVAGVIFGYIGFQSGLKKQCKDEGKNTGSLMSDIGYIKAGIDDLKRKQETSELRHYELVERVTKAEESLKSAWYEIKKGKKEDSNV